MDHEPVCYVGAEIPNHDYHDGQLRWAVGVHNIQVLRANRRRRDQAEGYGWTYNHAPMLAYWHGRFYLEYLSNPVGEHCPPGQTLLTHSPDGIHWEKPGVVFPVYPVPDGIYQGPPEYPLAPGSFAVMHQRMGFHVAPNDRLLVLGFYGISPTPDIWPNDGRGIGRVVREVRADGSCGPIYFLRYNRHAGWHEGNTLYPFYQVSDDPGFVEACDSLLADKLKTLQWWEEDRSPDSFYAVEGYKALSYYHLPDGRVVGLWKWSKAAISTDEGRSWSPVRDVPSLVMAGAKIWGQRTSDGRYALLYNPTLDDQHRWPLVVVTSDDGVSFADMLAVAGDVSPQRYNGYLKDFGLNYVRGITEGDGTPPDGGTWVAYSMNKEDIWVCRVPVPVIGRVDVPVHDTFDDAPSEGLVPGWNIYSPLWCPVSVADFPSASDKSLMLADQDPYDYAKAGRIFPESTRVTVRFRMLARQVTYGQLHCVLTDRKGSAPVRMIFDGDGWFKAKNKGYLRSLRRYAANTWYEVCITAEATTSRYSIAIDGEPAVSEASFVDPVRSLERLVFRTGRQRWEPTTENERTEVKDLPGADEPVRRAVYYINYVMTADHELVRSLTNSTGQGS